MWLPGLLSLTSPAFSSTPIHFPSPTFLIFTRESRRATVSPGEVGVRGGGGVGARQGGEHWGEKREERLILDAIPACLAVKLDSSHTPAVCRAPRGSCYFFFPHPAAKCVKLSAWFVRLLPQRLVWSPPGKHGVLSQPSSLTAFPSHSGVIKKEPHVPHLLHPCSPSPLVFSFHRHIALFRVRQRCECVWLTPSTPPGPD